MLVENIPSIVRYRCACLLLSIDITVVAFRDPCESTDNKLFVLPSSSLLEKRSTRLYRGLLMLEDIVKMLYRSEQVNCMVIVDNGSSGRGLGRLGYLDQVIFEKVGVFHGYTP